MSDTTTPQHPLDFVARPRERHQYFYRNNACKATKSTDPACICWHDEGTGPMNDLRHGSNYAGFSWRVVFSSSLPASPFKIAGDEDHLTADQSLIAAECDRIKHMLLGKNRRYGNSALEPKRIFSKASSIEQICVRIDDKLSRLQTTGFSGAQEDGERTLDDLIGYLVLLNVALASSVEKVSNHEAP